MSKLNWTKKAYAVVLLCATMATWCGSPSSPPALAPQTLSTLHSFDDTDGANPDAALVQATDGNLYGTTYGGGTVFKITPSGTLTTLYSFCSLNSVNGCTDGAYPYAGLVQATDGNFYGTTDGGANDSSCAGIGCGTVFRITPSGTLTTLQTFDFTDGASPSATLVAGPTALTGRSSGSPQLAR